MALVDVLIPTCNRKTSLGMLLASLLGQTFTDFDVTVADQSDDGAAIIESIEIQTAARALEYHGHRVRLLRNMPRIGMAQQRQFLLEQSSAPYLHYLDDDVLLEPQVMGRMLGVLWTEGCGFVGCAATGLEHHHDVRPHQQNIELWHGPVRPEPFDPDTIPWHRHTINNAANVLHLAEHLAPGGEPVRYKVAWVGGANVLYDHEKLLDVGGFSWWERLPPAHAGEEVVVQFLLLRKYGGCGVLPSGTYHLGLPTNVPDRQYNATELFGELIAQFNVYPTAPVEPLHEVTVGA